MQSAAIMGNHLQQRQQPRRVKHVSVEVEPEGELAIALNQVDFREQVDLWQLELHLMREAIRATQSPSEPLRGHQSQSERQ